MKQQNSNSGKVIAAGHCWPSFNRLAVLLGQKLNTKKGFDNTRTVWQQLQNTSKAQARLN